MIVVGVFKLIFDDDFPAGIFVGSVNSNSALSVLPLTKRAFPSLIIS